MEHRIPWPNLWRRCSKWVIRSARWQVFVTSRHLCIVMDYATAGELFEYVKRSVRLREDSARYFFQQLARPCLQSASTHHRRGVPPRISPWFCLLRCSVARTPPEHRTDPIGPPCHLMACWHRNAWHHSTDQTRPKTRRGCVVCGVHLSRLSPLLWAQVSGISFCHTKGVSHRDLKLENSLIHVSADQTPRLKICDFGFSKVSRTSPAAPDRVAAGIVFRSGQACCLPTMRNVYGAHGNVRPRCCAAGYQTLLESADALGLQHNENDSDPKSAKGTVEYLAPEVVLCSYRQQYDGRQSDVWSCGVILYLMLCCAPPPPPPRARALAPQRLLT